MLNDTENMDELFRKAAGDYPLRLEPGDWDKIVAAQHINPINTSLSLKKYWLIFALLFLGTTLVYFIYDNNEKAKVIASLTNNMGRNNPTRPAVEELKTLPNNDIGAALQTAITDAEQSEKKAGSVKAISAENLRPKPGRANQGSFTGNNVTLRKTKQPSNKLTSKNGSGTVAQNIFQLGNDRARIEAATLFNESTAVAEFTPNLSLSTDIEHKMEITEPKIEQAQPAPTNIAVKDTGTKKKLKNNLYAGLSSTLNYSLVGNQHTSAPMAGFGAIAGLEFSKRFSLESGILFFTKNYYTKGSFFNPKPGTMPATMQVKTMQGKIKTIDIPLDLKFNLSRTKQSFFAIVGVSNTILTRENNVYDTRWNGQDMIMRGEYNETHFYPAASLNFSVGYQKDLVKNYAGRLEPFVQIPLRGTGIGYLPVTNFGLKLSFIRK